MALPPCTQHTYVFILLITSCFFTARWGQINLTLPCPTFGLLNKHSCLLFCHVHCDEPLAILSRISCDPILAPFSLASGPLKKHSCMSSCHVHYDKSLAVLSRISCDPVLAPPTSVCFDGSPAVLSRISYDPIVTLPESGILAHLTATLHHEVRTTSFHSLMFFNQKIFPMVICHLLHSLSLCHLGFSARSGLL